jgi:hypothetical protein
VGMDANKLFEMALVLGKGWRVVKSEMDVAGRQLQLRLARRLPFPGAGTSAGITTRLRRARGTPTSGRNRPSRMRGIRG